MTRRRLMEMAAAVVGGWLGLRAAAGASGDKDDAARTYHKVTVAGVASTKWTHVEVEGIVAYVAREGDGDVHIRLVDGAGGGAFCVAEIIPGIPVRAPRKGDRVRVRGISRVDKTHGWGEVHPVEEMENIRA